MNFLAHAYLSFNDPEILVGNMISDFVKGKRKFDYPENILNGIMLHRAIDEFTDFHPATQLAKEYFREEYRLYSGAFIDIVYDHFLANDPIIFSKEVSLARFAENTYRQLDGFAHHFPEVFKMLFPYMKNHNWLYNYRSLNGIKNSFEGLVRRAAYLSDSSAAFLIFQANYDELKNAYDLFFPSLENFAKNHLQLLIQK
jgi:acyl carrier protein phosphodiesterase